MMLSWVQRRHDTTQWCVQQLRRRRRHEAMSEDGFGFDVVIVNRVMIVNNVVMNIDGGVDLEADWDQTLHGQHS